MQDALFVLRLCERFHCLPSQLEQEDAEIIRLLAIADRGIKKTDPDEEEVED